jgi:uncharacterized protein (TIGR02145 family)
MKIYTQNLKSLNKLLKMRNTIRIKSLFGLVLMLNLFVNVFRISALNYSIVFSGTGASNVVDSVVVYNLTKSTQVTVLSGKVLNLYEQSNNLKLLNGETQIGIYPNPIVNTSNVEFFVSNNGVVSVEVFDLSGKLVHGTSKYLQQGSHSFLLSLPLGQFILKLHENSKCYTSKILSNVNSTPHIEFVLQESKVVNPIQHIQVLNSPESLIMMEYTDGDVLLYKAFSNGYLCSIVTDVPNGSKTTNFNFIDCSDIDGNHYPVVTIGTQTWMAENLRVKKFRNGDTLTLASKGSEWTTIFTGGYCNSNNVMSNDSVLKYGLLYNFHAVNDSRGLAPKGWHISTQTEWDTLIAYVDKHYANSLNGAKAISSKHGWKNSSTSIFNVGNNQVINNSKGFNAIPAGFRGASGMFFSLYEGAVFWTNTLDADPTKALAYGLSYGSSNVVINSGSFLMGMSIRCVKD